MEDWRKNCGLLRISELYLVALKRFCMNFEIWIHFLCADMTKKKRLLNKTLL